ncbi:phage tail tube protein [Salipiger marinus]|uniref:phage tail tube protein n=1 Tax=Salipiger marinus TaxID=555512 RepID=UPI002CBBAB73|nr:phage tail tube protein [Salipiger manganoxidans]MEB3417552.1 phage tail tube protein [Salipiger manganoxidans]
MTRHWKKLAILHKLETAYATDAAPLAADAIIASNVTFTPMEGEEVTRDLMLPYLGNQGVLLAGVYARLEFDVEIAGAGALGDIPKYGSLLRIAGFSETVDAGVAVEYSIVETGLESGSIYFVSDKVQHVMLGCQANVALTFTAKGIPRYRFTVIGLLGTITDLGTMPAVTTAGWITPVIVSKANTVMTLHGWTAVAESLSVDRGNVLTPRFNIGDERMSITDRSATGSTVVEARSIATIDWFARALARTRGELSLVHGTTAGNTVEIAAPAVEVGRPTQGQTDNIVNYTVPLMLCPEDGLDELTITVR